MINSIEWFLSVLLFASAVEIIEGLDCPHLFGSPETCNDDTFCVALRNSSGCFPLGCADYDSCETEPCVYGDELDVNQVWVSPDFGLDSSVDIVRHSASQTECTGSVPLAIRNEFYCSDSTLPGQTGILVDVTCRTFCLVGYSKNFFLGITAGIDALICQSVGCAIVDSNGSFVNDVKERLGLAAEGEITVYSCDESSYQSSPPNALQGIQGMNPCNWYNPDALSGVVDVNDQGCTELVFAGTEENVLPWILANFLLFIGILATTLVLIVILSTLLCIRRQRRNRKKKDALNVLDKSDEAYDDKNMHMDKPCGDELFLLCCQMVRLRPGVTRANLWTLLLSTFATIGLLVFLNAMQGFLLTEIYGVSVNDIGKVTANIGLVDELWSIVTLGFWGTISDKYGRRKVVVAGYAQISLGCLLIPNAVTVAPGLVLSRLVYAQGASALSSVLTALIADYVVVEDLGKGAALLGIASGFGALFSVFVLVGVLPPSICIVNTYYTTSALSMIMSVVCALGLQKFSVFLEHNESGKDSKRQRVFFLLWEGLKAARNNSKLGLAYIAGFLARGDSVVVSIFLSLWMNKYYAENEFCIGGVGELSTCSENIANPDSRLCSGAFTQFRRLSGLNQVAALVGGGVFGYLGDVVDPSLAVAGSSALGLVSYLLVNTLESPDVELAYLVVTLWGFAQIAMVVSAQFLVTKNMPEDIRGSVASCFSAFGAVGVMTITYGGGYLFDEWQEQAPFTLVGILSGFVFFAAVVIIRVEKKAAVSSQSSEL